MPYTRNRAALYAGGLTALCVALISTFHRLADAFALTIDPMYVSLWGCMLVTYPVAWLYFRRTADYVEAGLEIQRLSETDQVTGLLRRSDFEARVAETLAGQAPDAVDAALLVFDIDHFGELNDHYGTGVGDEALAHVANVLQMEANDVGLLGTLGRGQIGLLMSGKPIEVQQRCSEDLVKAVLDHPLCLDSAVIELSVSCGFARLTKPSKRASFYQQLLAAAREALAQAKNNGRNRVVMNV